MGTSRRSMRILGFSLVGLLGLGLTTVAEEGSRAGSIKKVPFSKILKASRSIDQFIEADLKKEGLQTNLLVNDETFVRRVYLSIVGRIPTAAEASAFLDARKRNKRPELIDQLLESPGYNSHLFNWMADLLRVRTRMAQVSGEPYIHFIKESIAENKPYDQFVRGLLTADGPANKRDNGATGYYLRDRNMLEDNMSNTVRIFLGTRLECAQCHDHPFDKWTQMNYMKMVAFTAGLRYRDEELNQSKDGKRLAALGEKIRKEGTPKGVDPNDRRRGRNNIKYRAYRQVLRSLGYGLAGDGQALYRLPHDYQYDDAKPNQIVKAEPMFGEAAEFEIDPKILERDKQQMKRRRRQSNRRMGLRSKDVNSRDAYAKWMTGPENPRFTTVIANRMWKRAMGIGQIEPLDDLSDKTKASHPELMTFLEELMTTQLGYDLKQYLRVLYNTKTFQREAVQTEPVAGEKFFYQGPVLRRLTGEQLWDSMLTLVVPDLDLTLLAPDARSERIYQDYERLVKTTEKDLREQTDLMVLRYTDPQKYREKYRELRRRQQQERSREMTKNRKKAGPLYQKLAEARKKGDQKTIEKINEQLKQMGVPATMMMGSYRSRGGRTSLSRASDLQSPAPAGHFLRQFGQSDREQIENSHTDPSVTQVLALLNGFVERFVSQNRRAVLNEVIARAASPEQKIEQTFLSLLGRKPTSQERELWMADAREGGDAVIKDLVWTLVNTHEFMFVQ